jgi:hypothetical protein
MRVPVIVTLAQLEILGIKARRVRGIKRIKYNDLNAIILIPCSDKRKRFSGYDDYKSVL